jgi:hypothetical protein
MTGCDVRLKVGNDGGPAFSNGNFSPPSGPRYGNLPILSLGKTPGLVNSLMLLWRSNSIVARRQRRLDDYRVSFELLQDLINAEPVAGSVSSLDRPIVLKPDIFYQETDLFTAVRGSVLPRIYIYLPVDVSEARKAREGVEMLASVRYPGSTVGQKRSNALVVDV